MTYRDDLQAARMRRDALARELHQMRGRMDERDGLARQAEALERELAQTARDLDRARARVELPLLQRVEVASPCKERWDDMAGDEHARFCGRCEKNVYDLSSLTASQAEALLQERGESLCVRFFRRSDGTILTSDCPVGARRRFWRRTAAAAVASGLVAAGIAMAAAASDGPLSRAMFRVIDADQGQRLSGEATISPSRVDVQAQELAREIGEAQTRLAAARTAEDMHAIQWEIENLQAEVDALEERRRQSERAHVTPEVCRRSPLDC